MKTLIQERINYWEQCRIECQNNLDKLLGKDDEESIFERVCCSQYLSKIRCVLVELRRLLHNA